jgi:hypothetical protein
MIEFSDSETAAAAVIRAGSALVGTCRKMIGALAASRDAITARAKLILRGANGEDVPTAEWEAAESALINCGRVVDRLTAIGNLQAQIYASVAKAASGVADAEAGGAVTGGAEALQ